MSDQRIRADSIWRERTKPARNHPARKVRVLRVFSLTVRYAYLTHDDQLTATTYQASPSVFRALFKPQS